MNGYTKLFQSILASSIWSEDDQTRIVWITLLAMADQHGEIHASIPGVARMASVPLAAAEAAIAKFLGPDPYSRTPDNEGRRIVAIDGGWLVVNHAKYRLMASKEDSKRKTAERVARHRDAKRNEALQSVTGRYMPLQSAACNDGVTQGTDIAEAEADTNTPPNPQGGIEQTLKLETEPAPKPRDPMEGFSLFWQAYPKKQGRTPAEKAWRKLQPDAETVRKIVEHVQARRTSEDWTKELGQFIPLPSTFLNQRRWTDETRVDVKPTATGKSGTTEDRLVAQSGVTL